MASVEKMETDSQVMATYQVMKQLRTQVVESEYLERVRRQEQTNNYHLAAVIEDSAVKCVAGYRISECLLFGSFLYVDDLVTDEAARSKNYGKQMMDWLVEEARRNGCSQIHLDSGVQRFAAHRFYLRERMDIICYHFSKIIESPTPSKPRTVVDGACE